MNQTFLFLKSLFIFLLINQSTMAQSTSSNAGNANIKFEKQQNQLHIKGTFESPSLEKEALRYSLQTEKTGSSGQTRNQQSGTFVTIPGQEVVLSQLNISVSPKDNYTIRLAVFNRENQLISQDSVVFEGNLNEGKY